MKQIFVSLTALITIGLGCTRDGSAVSANSSSNNGVITNSQSCETVIITQQGLGCDLWGIKIDNKVYPAFNLPEQYRKEGTTACVEYVLFEDMRNCPAPCCGGVWADIKSIQ